MYAYESLVVLLFLADAFVIIVRHTLILRVEEKRFSLLDLWIRSIQNKVPVKELRNIQISTSYYFQPTYYELENQKGVTYHEYKKIRLLHLGEDVITDFSNMYIEKAQVGEEKFLKVKEYLSRYLKSNI